MQKQITLAIITRNRDKLLAKCLASLEKQTLKCSELLVIDNASKDQTRNVVKQFKKILPIHYLYESRIGIPFARNRALKEAKGEIIAFIDDDCEAKSTWIEEMAKAHAEYPKAAAIQGRLEVLDPKSLFGIVAQRNYDSWLRLNLMGENRISMINTSNVSFKKNLLQKNKIVFDTRFYRFCCGEDTDIALQLIAKGQAIIYDPRLFVFFRSRTTLFGFLGRRFRAGAANILLTYKWPRIFPPSRKADDQFIAQNVVLNWSQRTLLGIVYAFSKRAYLSGKIIEEVRMLQTQLLHKNSSSNEKIRQKLFLAASIIRQCRDATFPLYVKLLGSLGLYLLIAFFFFQRKERQSLEVFISQGKSLRPNKTNRSVSVAVVTRDRASFLYGCLSSLSRQTIFPKEVLVIDNGSTDETKEIALSFQHILPLRYLKEPQIGIPYARNRTLKEAKGEILAFLDDDCEVTPTWIDEVIKAHRRYPKATAIQGDAISLPRENIISIISGSLFGVWIRQNIIRETSVSIIDTKSSSFKMSKVKPLHIQFDPTFTRGSDIDFAKQLLTKKQIIVYDQNVFIFHWERNNIFSFLKQRYEIGKSYLRLEYKWPAIFFLPESHKNKLLYLTAIKHMEQDLNFFKRLYLRSILALTRIVRRIGYKNAKKKELILEFSPISSSQRRDAKISVAIATRNREDFLKKCLISLSHQTVYPKEVLVIDNNSLDNTRSVVFAFQNILPIRYLWEGQVGIAFAKNRALKEAKGKIVAFIDDDCEATLTWIEEMLKAHELYPKAAAIQGGSSGFPKEGVISAVSQIYYEKWFSRYLSSHNRLTVIDGKNVSLKRNILKKLGILFDTSFPPYGSDDIDLANQLLTKKQTIVYCPRIEVFAWWRTSFLSFFKQRFYKGFARAFLDNKWHSNAFLSNQNTAAIKKYKRVSIFSLVFFLSKIVFRLGYFTGQMRIIYNYSLLTKDLSLLGNALKRISPLRISIMIITKDRYDSLSRCLRSLINQSKKPDQIIIVDSSSQPNLDAINKFKKNLPITYIYEKRLGFGVARNTGIKRAKSDILATIDDDGEAPRNWCESIVRAHLQNPKALAIQGRILSKPSTLSWAQVEQIRMDRWFLNNLDRTGKIRTMSTKNVSFKLKRFRKLKLNFSTLSAFNTYGAEDIDMARQILLAKEDIIFSPSVSVYHWERQTLISYLKQQYRKGCSNTLVAEWLNQEKQPSRLSLPKVMQPILEQTWHPLTRGKIFRIIQLLPIYYLSLVFFQMGLNQKILKPMVMKQKKTRSFVVAIITRNRAQSLRRALYSLENQTVLPSKVLVIDSASTDNTTKIVDSFKDSIPIRYVYEPRIGISYARNRALKEAQGEILAFLDDDCEATHAWVEKMLEAHRKYRTVAIIQGRSISAPKDSIFSVIGQFNRQKWVRDAMLGNRNLYWEWIQGKLHNDFEIPIYDTKNLSMKLDRIQRLHITFDEKLEPGLDAEFGDQFFSKGEKSIYYPKAIIYQWEKENLRDFLKQCWFQGRTNARISSRWPKGYIIQRKRVFLKKLLAFTYFCIVNKHVVNLPILIGLFLLYHHEYRRGSLYEKQYTASTVQYLDFRP